MTFTERSSIAQANQLLREGYFVEAKELYKKACIARPELSHICQFNMAYIERKISSETAGGFTQPAPAQEFKNTKSSDTNAPAKNVTMHGVSAFFTICSKNFLAHARTLRASIRPHYPEARFFLVLCDKVEGLLDPKNEPFEFVYLDELSLPNLTEMASRYNITEFNTAVKPFAFIHLMERYNFDSVVYLDPDLYFVDRMYELDELLAGGAEAVLTPHILQPAEGTQTNDRAMLQYGIYNLGFLALLNTEKTKTFLHWWGRRLERECVIRIEEGIFVDQKWADLLPAFVPATRILHHPGYNVAYWNLMQRTIIFHNDRWLANGQPLRFVHFSGNKIDDVDVFSRHNQEVTIQNIGDLRILLDCYRQAVYEQGHEFYRSLPYAYSWLGEAGINLHTPQELDISNRASQIDDLIDNGTGTIKRLLYIDWAIPKPDKDAASVTAFLLLQIFDSLGFKVTFVPASLAYEEGYYEDLVGANIDVVVYPAIQSMKDWLQVNIANFDCCVLARGPVAWPYLQTIKAYAPNLRLIFNTVDLHYLRELRQAELENDEDARQAALVVREQELDLVDNCDLTIVLSNDELYTVRELRPEAPLVVLPVVFKEIPGAIKGFEQRRDILFIGSFPHKPNIDAVVYFARSIFPLIKRQIPSIRLKVIGANPPEEILRLGAIAGIEILGFVKDLEPVFSEIRLTIAPLRYGAGIKGKIGTSLCYGVPCVATSMAVEGMGLTAGLNVLVGDTPRAFASAVCDAYQNPSRWQTLSTEGHKFAAENYSVEVIQKRVSSMLFGVSHGWRVIRNVVELDGWETFKKHAIRMQDEYERRVIQEQDLLPVDGTDGFRTSGFCCVCGTHTRFLTSLMYSTGNTPDGRSMPNWREHMQCEHCGLVNRMRAALNVLHTIAPPDIGDQIYITERLTKTFDWLAVRYPKLQGSEYFGPTHLPGSLVNGIRHEDVMNLSFAEAAFDRVLSFDVLEHVPDPDRAFRALYRVLKPNGVLIFSVPFSSDSEVDIVRATLEEDGSITHLLPAEYHGNPVDPEGGALCFRHFGWEMLEKLRTIGFKSVRCLAYWSMQQGYLGREQYLFIAAKN